MALPLCTWPARSWASARAVRLGAAQGEHRDPDQEGVDEANATFEALRRRRPQSPTVSTGLGAVSLISGQAEQAKRHFLETLAKDPRDVAALQWLAVLEEDANANPAEALRRCEQIEQLVPGRLGTEDCIRRNRARLTTLPPGLP